MRTMIRRRGPVPAPAAGRAARPFAGRAALVAALAAATALAGGQAATAAGSATIQTATIQTTAVTPAASAQTVSLPTGEQVTVHSAAGKTTYSVAGAAGGPNAFASYQAGTADHYIIPAEAEPYVGSVLSPSLFDVTQLLRAGLSGGARLPVSLAFAAGATPAAPPGVTLTSTAGSTAQGYLTASSGAAFAAGLRAAIGADVAAGRPAGSGPLFGGLASMSLASAAVTAPPTVQPDYVLHTLQVDATDINGAPTSVFGLLMNNASFNSLNAFLPINDGIGRIEVPAGDYSLGSQVLDFNAQGNVTAARMVVLDDFTVPDTAGATTTVQFDERTATSPISATTPRPAAPQDTIANWVRLDPTGDGDTVGFTATGGLPMYVDPQPAAVTAGTLHFQVQFGLVGPATGPQYRYDAAFDDAAIPADQSYVVRQDQLATVKQDFYTDPAAGGAGDSFLITALDSYTDQFIFLSPIATYSGPVTEYLGTADSGQWLQGVENSGLGLVVGDTKTYAAGHGYADDWARGPLAANVGQYVAPGFDGSCFACASGGALSVGFNPISDSEPDHIAVFNFGQSVDDALYEDGTQVFSQDGATGVEVTGIPATPTTWREVYNTGFAGVSTVSQSTATHTDLTFQYPPAHGTDATLPSTYLCDYTGTVAAPCQVLPVLTLRYRLAESQENTSAASVQTMQLTVGHLSYAGQGSHAPITSASVSVSFDGGATWRPALVAGVNGHYTAIWRNPASAAGTSPELRVTAKDAVGGSITQTITAAYTVAGQLK